MSSDKNLLISHISDTLQEIDIAGYLKDEIVSLLKYVNVYKINNMFENIEALKEYLVFLDHHSTQQIHALEYDAEKPYELTGHDIHYYVSHVGLNIVGEQKLRQKLWENDYNLSYAMQAVKGFLLLTADEFCNATPTRMSINRMIWQKQMSKK